LNEIYHYHLYFPEEHPRCLEQNIIIETLDQAKAPECHEAMVSADIFEISYEESISDLKRLENLEKVKSNNVFYVESTIAIL
jgi:hypothetical protein